VALAGQLQAAQLPAPPPPPKSRHYTVRSGDTLYAIAKRFHCDSAKDLARNNHMHVSSNLRVGDRLRLEGCRR
jgi:membrane-bound lytic murein transglycosylase D